LYLDGFHISIKVNLKYKAQSLPIFASIALLAGGLDAKDRHKKASDAPQDQIRVVGHVALTEGLVTRFLTTQHFRRNYLYAQSNGGKSVTLIDVTDVSHPVILAGIATPSSGGAELVAAAGTAALLADGHEADQRASTAQTFRIMSFADPVHPVVKQEFPKVSAMAWDDQRALIFLANPEGVWILQQKLAKDPNFEKEWEHMMLDAR
jgi:hypothetical protein